MLPHLAGLSPADLAILFEPNPYAYDSTVIDPSLPPSPFVQVMREQEESFYAVFPDAKKAAECYERRRQQLCAFLASRNTHSQITPAYGAHGPLDSTSLNHTYPSSIYNDDPEFVPAIPTTYSQDNSYSLLPTNEEPKLEPHPTVPTLQPPQQQQQQQPHSPTHHDRHPKEGDHHSASQLIVDEPASPDCVDRPRKAPPKAPYTPRTRNKNPNPKRRAGNGTPRKRLPHQFDSRKPPLACLFCHGRKIACGAPLPGSIGKTCNQCQRRSLPCEFPAKSRHGTRKRRISNRSDEDQDAFESILSP